MRSLWLIAFAILITGCELTPPTVGPTFAGFEQIDEREATYPDALPKLDKLECIDDADGECLMAVYRSADSIKKLSHYQIVAEANTEIATANAQALDATLEQAEQLVSAGKAEEALHAIREEQLQFERRQRQIDKWYYRAMLVLLGAAGIAAAD